MTTGMELWLSRALWLAGAAHFCILPAGLQVPYRFDWKNDLASLKPFNRKLFWVYAGFTLLTIIAFGTLTLILHDELLRGDRAAVGLAAFIGTFWTTRIVVDCVYYDHKDWPPGRAFIVGHALLNLAFLLMAATYITIVVVHV
jgi:hypothetical protein